MRRSALLFVFLFAAVVTVVAVALAGCGCESLLDTTTTETTSTTLTDSTDTANGDATATSAHEDGIESSTSTTGPLVEQRFEENDGRLVYEGTWSFGAEWFEDYLSGGSAASTTATGSSVTVKFYGTAISLVTVLGNVGEIKVTVDSGTPFIIDCYHSETPVSFETKVIADNLDEGVHFVRLENPGTKNPASASTGFFVDAFDIVGDLLPQ